MSINVIAHDTRLEGRTPVSTTGTISFEVNEDTPIQEFFDRVIRISNENSGINTLNIMAHGVTFTMGTEDTDDDSTGIQFCNPPISNLNIHLFRQLRQKVDRIVLFVCHAAETAMTTHGDGDQLCRQMAFIAQAEVTAARENQIFHAPEAGIIFIDRSPIEFGQWEGTVVVYDRNGIIISEFNNPSGWRDSDGVLHDPRIDVEPSRRDAGASHTTMRR